MWVISDEIYEHLNYDGAKTAYVGVEVPECRDQLLVLNGVAKTYAMPGWRVGWMVAPRARRQGRRQAAGPFELQRFQLVRSERRSPPSRVRSTRCI